MNFSIQLQRRQVRAGSVLLVILIAQLLFSSTALAQETGNIPGDIAPPTASGSEVGTTTLIPEATEISDETGSDSFDVSTHNASAEKRLEKIAPETASASTEPDTLPPFNPGGIAHHANQGDTLQEFSGTFNADLFSGSASFTYPLQLPPGRNNLTPVLGLHYSSANSRPDSLAGFGWDSTSSSITRTSKKPIQDIFTDTTFTSSIFGQNEELVLVNAATGEYRPKVEGSFRIYTLNNNTWLVKDKNGTVYTFGNSSASRQDDPLDASHIYQWMLEKIEDRNGNTMLFSYTKNQGYVYPDTIRYTGNGNDPGIYQVQFGYAPHPRPVERYATGFFVKLSQRLTSINIQVKHGASYETVNSYQLSYDDSDVRGLLSQIQIVTASGTLPPTRFGYTHDAPVGTPYIPSGLLQLIQTPYGASTQLMYRSSAQYIDAIGMRLNPKLPFTMTTVAQVSTKNTSADVPKVMTYEYAQGHYFTDFYDHTKREYAGFGIVTVKDAAGNVQKNYFHQSEKDFSNTAAAAWGEYQDHLSKKGLIYRSESYDHAGHLYAVSVNKYDRTDLGNARNFPFLVQSVSMSYDGTATHRDTAVSYTYDAYGNVLTQKNWGEVVADNAGSFTDLGNDTVIRETSYALNAAAYITALPQQVVIKDGSNSILQQQRFYYDGLALGEVSKGNVTKQEDWLKESDRFIPVKQQAFNALGLPTSVTDARGKVTAYTYDTFNLYPLAVTNPLGHGFSFVYDYDSGKVKETLDPNGAKTTNTYDSLGRLLETRVTNPTNPSSQLIASSMQYFDAEIPVRIVTTQFNGQPGDVGKLTIKFFDGFGHLLQTRNTAEAVNEYAVTSILYDEQNRVKKELLPIFETGASFTVPNANAPGSSFSYDSLDRVLAVSNSLGTTATSYDKWTKLVTDANGHQKKFYFDAYQNLVQVDEKNGSATYTTRYDYDRLQRLAAITDAEGNVRNFTYDSLSRLLSQDMLHKPTANSSQLTAWNYTYDDTGNVVQKTDPNGQVVSYTYDDLNRPLTEDFAGTAGVEVSNEYDIGIYAKGKVNKVSTAGLVQEFGYGILGNQEVLTQRIDGKVYNTYTSYDLLGNVLNVSYNNFKTISYQYNKAYLIDRVTEGLNVLVANVDYNPQGLISKIDFGNGTSTVNTYDPQKLYRLTNKKTTKGANIVYQNIDYTYDPVGNLINITENAATAAQRNAVYTYDDLDRLLSATTIRTDSLSANQNTFIQNFDQLVAARVVEGDVVAKDLTSAVTSSAVTLTSLTPGSGLAGASIVALGTNFAPTNNEVNFVGCQSATTIYGISSANGTTLNFAVPFSSNISDNCIVMIRSNNVLSNGLPFTIVASNSNTNSSNQNQNTNSLTQTFSYSPTGNILSNSLLGNYVYNGTSNANPQAVTHIGSERSYMYDKNGNVIATANAGVSHNLRYDYRNNMVESSTGTSVTKYMYDARHGRMKKWNVPSPAAVWHNTIADTDWSNLLVQVGETDTATETPVILAAAVTGPVTLSGLNPTSGPPGTVVTLTGTNFSSTSNRVRMECTGTGGGQKNISELSSANGTSLSFTVPSSLSGFQGACTVSARNSTVATYSNGLVFTVNGVATLAGLSPASGPPVTNVTVTGTNFTSTGNTVQMKCGTAGVKSIANLVSANGTSLTFSVPAALSTYQGNCMVSVRNSKVSLYSAELPFTVKGGVTLSGVNPAAGPVGTAVTLAGENFSSTGNTVKMVCSGTGGGTKTIASIDSPSGTSVVFTVPATLSAFTGNCNVSARSSAIATYSNSLVYRVGTVATNGNGNSSNQNTNAQNANSNGANSNINSGSSNANVNASNQNINAANVNINLNVNSPAGNTNANMANQNLNAPQGVPVISTVTPDSGAAGTLVTLHGSGFTATGNTVTFKKCSPLYQSASVSNLSSTNGTDLVFAIPATLTEPGLCQSLLVGNPNGFSNSVSFTITTGTSNVNTNLNGNGNTNGENGNTNGNGGNGNTNAPASNMTLYLGGYEVEGTADPNGVLTTQNLKRLNINLGSDQGVSIETDLSSNVTRYVYHHTDFLTGGSVDTDQNGYMLQVQDYMPFGTNRVDQRFSSYANKKKFTGKELDGESGLYYYGARYYDSDIGRWMGLDPLVLGEVKEKKIADLLMNPQELNGYTYVLNNPLKYVDITGLLTQVIVRSARGLADIKDFGHVAISINGRCYDFYPISNDAGKNLTTGNQMVRNVGTISDFINDPTNKPGDVFSIFTLSSNISLEQEKMIEEYLKSYNLSDNGYSVGGAFIENGGEVCTTVVINALKAGNVSIPRVVDPEGLRVNLMLYYVASQLGHVNSIVSSVEIITLKEAMKKFQGGIFTNIVNPAPIYGPPAPSKKGQNSGAYP